MPKCRFYELFPSFLLTATFFPQTFLLFVELFLTDRNIEELCLILKAGPRGKINRILKIIIIFL